MLRAAANGRVERLNESYRKASKLSCSAEAFSARPIMGSAYTTDGSKA